MQPNGRLPVNQRRRKVAPEHRKRVARACNSCNVRRIKCSGDNPCRQCQSGSRDCVYPSAPERKDEALKSEVERLRERCIALEHSLSVVVPDEAARNELLQRTNIRASSQTSDAASSPYEDEAVETEGRLLLDPDGNARFLGETSGATFLELLRHFMLTLVPLTFAPAPGQAAPEDGSMFVASIGQYHTLDSRPLHDPDVDPLWLPSRADMTAMLSDLRCRIQDGNGKWASGGMYYWGDLTTIPAAVTLAPSETDAINSDKYRYLAFHHMTFAVSAHLAARDLPQGQVSPGESYFKRARLLLGNPLDTARFSLSDVPVLSMMGFYLVELYRRDAAYLYVSLAIHIAITHGAFRHCVNESNKRIIWTLYVLDIRLAALLGRPPIILEEAIRLPLPVDTPCMPPCVGLLSHVMLGRVATYLICETFKIAPREQKTHSPTHDIEKVMGKLQDWFARLPPAMQMPADGSSTDAACCTLHLCYNQLVILATRPLLLVTVKKAVAEHYMQSGKWRLEEHPQYKHIQACTAAAQSNITLTRRNVQVCDSRLLLHYDMHFVFNAAIILLLNRIFRTFSVAAEADISFALDWLFKAAQTDSMYAQNCYQVLKDLSTLVDRFLAPETHHGFGHVYDFDYGQPEMFRGLDQRDGLLDDGVVLGEQGLAYPAEGEAVYQELMSWMGSDESLLHSTFRI